MMVICHQPYSEVKKIPVGLAIKLQNRFQEWIKEMFGKLGKSPQDTVEILTKIPIPKEWRSE
jgi:hypothetical protein